MFHQALAEALTGTPAAQSYPRRLWPAWHAQLPVGPDGQRQWAAAPRYLQQHGAEHAAAAGHLRALLQEPSYIAVADLLRLLPLLPDLADDPIAVLLQQAAQRAATMPPDQRLALLALTAARLGLGDLHKQFVAAGSQPWQVLWAHGTGVAYRELIGPAAR